MLLSPFYLHRALRAILIRCSRIDNILSITHTLILSLSLLPALYLRLLCNAHTNVHSFICSNFLSNHSTYNIKQESDTDSYSYKWFVTFWPEFLYYVFVLVWSGRELGWVVYVIFSLLYFCVWPGMVLNQRQLSIIVSDWESYLGSLFSPFWLWVIIFCLVFFIILQNCSFDVLFSVQLFY
jgi:hypothetical protein